MYKINKWLNILPSHLFSSHLVIYLLRKILIRYFYSHKTKKNKLIFKIGINFCKKKSSLIINLIFKSIKSKARVLSFWNKNCGNIIFICI